MIRRTTSFSRSGGVPCPSCGDSSTRHSCARFSSDLKYLWSLHRRWAEGGSSVLWIMLNPSTADGQADDPTVRRCCSFSKELGFSALAIVNLFGIVSSTPRVLAVHDSPVGLKND